MTQHCINDPEKVSNTQKTLLLEREIAPWRKLFTLIRKKKGRPEIKDKRPFQTTDRHSRRWSFSGVSSYLS